MAKTKPARWPALSRILAVVLVGGSLLPAAPAAAAAVSPDRLVAAAAEDGVILTVAPVGNGVIAPGQDLLLSGSVRNATAATISGGTLRLYLTADPIGTRDDLDQWLGPDAAGLSERLVATEQLKTPLLPGQELPLSLTVPAASVGLDKDAWDVRGVEATFTVAGDTTVSGRSTVVWNGKAPSSPDKLGVLVPITVPPGRDGLINAEDLAAYTAPLGILSSQLEAVVNRPVAIAIDPMIIASVRVLGTDAPPSALAWLDQLAHAKNDIFPLTYADSDIALEAQAETHGILEPATFQQAIDPSTFPSPAAVSPGAATRSPVPEEPATPAPLPASPADVLAWDYTGTDIAWPADGSVTPKNVDFFAASGLTTSIVSDSELTGAPLDRPAATLGKHDILVTDEALSTAVRRAAVASSDVEWRQAVATAQAQLAILADSGADGRAHLASIDRATARTAPRLAETLDALFDTAWTEPASLAELKTSPSKPVVTLNPAAQEATRADQVNALLARGKEIAAFATALTQPAALTGEYRLDLLAILATSWRSEPDEWQQAVTNSLAESAQTLDAVTITTEGPFLVVASQTDIPITLSNELDQAITVRVRLVPSNGRLLVDQETEATIDAGSANTVLVPVTAKVGNGSVMLHISVHSPTGVLIAEPKTVAVNVQAEWEGIGAVIFGILVVLFFGFGVWRNIARRRRERNDEPVAVGDGTGAEDAEKPEAGE